MIATGGLPGASVRLKVPAAADAGSPSRRGSDRRSRSHGRPCRSRRRPTPAVPSVLTLIVRAPPLSTVTRAAPAASTPGSVLSRSSSCAVSGLSCVLRVAADVHVDVGEQYPVDVVAKIHRRRVLQRPQEQSGTDEQHQAECDLRDDEDAAHPHGARTARHRAPFVAQSLRSCSAAASAARVRDRTAIRSRPRPRA